MFKPFAERRRKVQQLTVWPLELRIPSHHLGRWVNLSVLKPPGYNKNFLSSYPLVVVNDGQDFTDLKLPERLSSALRSKRVRPRVIVGVHADGQRMREYGTSATSDYAGRGDRANAHRLFVTEELLPYLEYHFRIRKAREQRTVCGFSLGGLSAFDIGWMHPELFANVGCFSASFWWRKHDFDPNDPDADRIAVEQIRHAGKLPPLSYYFQVGTDEEASDRNGNGIIDAIDDTLDVITALRERGHPTRALHYELVEGGEHNQGTWGPAFVDFLRWLDRR